MTDSPQIEPKTAFRQTRANGPFVVREGSDYSQQQPMRVYASHRAAVRSLALRGLLGVFLVTPSACSKRVEPAGPAADVTASEHGFSPSSLKLTHGGPGSHAAVTFVRTTDKTCATEVVFPDLQIERKLPLNEVVSVEVPTDTARTLTFQCGMAMYKGALVVTSP
jgi:plastocyanin domain-containing protein